MFERLLRALGFSRGALPDPHEADAPMFTEEPTSDPFEMSAVAKSANAFAFDLWSKLETQDNLVVCPASICAAIVMTWVGARGETADRMRNMLRLKGSIDDVGHEWSAALRALTGSNRAFQLRTANRLFGDAAYEFEEQFVEATAAMWGASLERLDFRSAPEAARATINAWVRKETEELIRELLPIGSIDATTRLALVNAIYFLGDWQDAFEKHRTIARPFFVSPKTPKEVPTMHRTGEYRLARASGTTVLELPYVGGDVVMLVCVPDRVDGLADLESNLSTRTVASWMGGLTPRRVEVALPRFSLDPPCSLELREPLCRLGIGVAFDQMRADFSGIANPRDTSDSLFMGRDAVDRLFIGEVFHKACAKVDEKGTEAAGATAVVMQFGCAATPEAPPRFVADHPFLFLIVERDTGLVLFAGRVVDPSAS